MRVKWLVVLVFAFILGLGWSMAWAQNVKVTPLGSHDGEFCRNDRALIFEDVGAGGLRVLYDPGRTVIGGSNTNAADIDARLGDVDVIILSSVHSDHIGDIQPTAVNAGTCAVPGTTSATPHSNTALIAAKKNSAVIAGGEMDAFLNKKISNARAGFTPALGAAANCGFTEIITRAASPTSPCTAILRHGGKRIVKLTGQTEGVQIAVVPAHHSNGIPTGFLAEPEKSDLAADNLTAYVGPENGFVLTFSNGLVVYLSADTGHTTDMATIVNDFYKAKLAVVNMGDIFSMGPEEAAFAVKRLIKPKAVIASHANEVATTSGSVNPGTRTERFIQLVTGIPVHVPLSGTTMEFDSNGTCVSGC